jgi:ABC-type glutathione transport system ATPase component
MREPLLRLEGLVKEFPGGEPWWRRAAARAVDDVTLEVRPGETLGIVGESGSGKSTLLRMALRLARPTSGRILVEGQDIWALRGAALKRLRRTMQPVFQDPGASFNPRQTLRQLLSAPLEVHGEGASSRERLARVEEALVVVGLAPALLDRYPHQLSGGQKQRVAIARAIVLRPRLLLLDEPTSALDVSVQAQVLNLFQRTKRELGLTCVFVSHNLAVVRYVSDRVAVMRHGRVVETGSAEELFDRPGHPYTRALLQAVPDVARALAERQAVPGHQASQGVSP